MRVPVTKDDIEAFVKDVFPDNANYRLGKKATVGQIRQASQVWLSDSTINYLEQLILQGDPRINDSELKYNIVEVQFFCDDFISYLLNVWIRKINFWKSENFKAPRKVVLYDAFELSIFCLSNYLRKYGKISGKESVQKTSWICISMLLQDIKPRLEAMSPLLELLEKKYTPDLYEIDEANKYKVLKSRQDDYKKKLKLKLEEFAILPKYHADANFQNIFEKIKTDRFTEIKDFKKLLEISLPINQED